MHELWYTFKIVYPKMNFIYTRYRSILIGMYTQNFAVEHLNMFVFYQCLIRFCTNPRLKFRRFIVQSLRNLLLKLNS